tara:strand:- start:5077 stop:5514 length:438 start_codon:yes stop_codon:yes gene_type:complete
MAYSGFKGIGPRGLGAHKGGNEGAGSVHAFDVSDNSSKKNQRDNFASQDGLNNSPAKQKSKNEEGPIEPVGTTKGTEGPVTKGRKEKMPQSGKGPKPQPKEQSPAKKNKGMSYDIKEASNQSLSKSARKHYAENAQAANKSGYKG